MSQRTTNSRTILDLLGRYAHGFAQGTQDDALLEHVTALLPRATDPDEFREIASRLWDELYCVDVDVMVQVLRRWLEIDPANKEAKRTLGGYLLAHGPDWDAEGNRLLIEGNAPPVP